MSKQIRPVSTKTARLKRLLAQVRYFDGLPVSVQRRLMEAAWPRHFDAGQVIYVEGEPAEALFIIERGWVKATRMSPQGREQALRFLHTGGIFGDVAIFTGSPYPGTVTALEAVDLWLIPAADILQLTGENPTLAMAIARRMGERVLEYVELIEDLSLRSVEARVAHTLLRHAITKDGQLMIPRYPWTTFDEMATRLGTVRDVLSRTLRALENDGLLRVERSGIILLDPEGLAARENS